MVEIINEVKCHSRAYKKGNTYKFWFECSFCGNGFVAFKSNVRRSTRSCGCARSQLISIKAKGRTPANKLEDKQAILNKVYTQYRNRARHKGFLFDLSISDVEELLFSNCYYCGNSPDNYSNIGQGEWKRTSKVARNGIDRYNNDLGYVLLNCVSCCKRCNYVKRDMNGDDFIELCNTISKERRSFRGCYGK